MRISTLALSAILASAGLASAGCGAETSDDVGVTSAALSVCDETVPSDRNVDGIPSYAQCAGAENAAIYSNNGVDTSTEQVDSSWVRTQYSGGYQCTELAHRYLYFKWDIDWLPNGNAGEWCDEVPPASSGVEQTDTAVHGDIMVLSNGSCGASDEFGHVTVVDVVEASGRLTVVEQNGARRGHYEASCAACFLHVVANTGEGGASGIGGAGGAGGEAGSDEPTGGVGAPAGGAGGPTGGVGGGSGGTSSIVAGIGGAGGTGSVGGASGMAALPSGGAGGVGGASGASSEPVAGAQAGASVALPRDNAAPEQCAVSRVGTRSSTSPSLAFWLFAAAATLLRVRRRQIR